MAGWGICSDSQIRAQAKYDSAHTARFSLKLNTSTDQDVIQWLYRQSSVQGSIKRLIRDEIARTNDVASRPALPPGKQKR